MQGANTGFELGVREEELRVAVCCSVLQCAVVCCIVLQCVAICVACDAVCCSTLQSETHSSHKVQVHSVLWGGYGW